jgi:hypothetical protein
MTSKGRYQDPEVLADLAFREASVRDPNRTRSDSNYTWTPPTSVGVWACRNPHCRRLTKIYQANLDAFHTFNRMLAARDEPPLDGTKIAFCEDCTVENNRTAPARRRAQVDRMADAIRQLKASTDPEQERELITNLVKWGHPDVAGLVTAIRERRAPRPRRYP